MRRLAMSGFLSLLTLIASCAPGPDLSPPSGSVVLPQVRLEGQPYDLGSGLKVASRGVVKTEATWAAEWATIIQDEQPKPPLPAIDFSSDMLVVVALGQQGTGGYAIYVDWVAELADGSIEVLVRSVSPGLTCVVTLAVTDPLDVVRVPRRDAPVHFREIAQVHDC